jgi:hypothetical protein
MLVALSAIVLGGSALVVSVVQVQIMRQEQHTSVWPRLQIGQSHSAGRNVSVVLANPGIGPAVIKDVRVEVDGKAMSSWNDVFGALMPARQPQDLVLMAIAGRIVPAGEVIRPISSSDPTFADAFAAASSRMRMRVCYCSVYDHCWWVADAFGDEAPPPERARSCEPGPSSFRN